MARIYDESGAKMSTAQVATALTECMPQTHKDLLRKVMPELRTGEDPYKRQIAHAILDAYRFLPMEAEDEAKSKKYCKFLMERYMKSVTPASADENKAMQKLADTIFGQTRVE